MSTNAVNNVDLFGWDTVYGISYSQVNEAIKTLKATPTSFQYQKEGSAFEDASSIAGEWGDWQLTTNGDGQNVTFKCPITSGTFTYNNKSYTFSNGNWIEIELELEYINQHEMDYIDETAKEGTGQQQNLVPNTTKQNASDSIVSIRNSQLSFDGLSNDENKDADDDCNPLFLNWFNNNLDKFEFIFSKLIVNQEADKEDFQWLKPTSVSYAVSSTNDLNTSVLGVMAMTENRTNSDTGHQIDANLLALSNQHSAFAFSTTRFAEKFLLPGLLKLIPGTIKDNYELASDGLTYTNTNKIEWTTFQDEDGKNKTATIDVNGLRLGIEDNKIKFEITNLQWEVKDGITVHVNYTDYYKVSLKSGVDNQGNSYKNVFTVEPTEKPELIMSYTTSDALRNKEIITGVFVELAGAILGGLAGGAVDGIMNGLSSAATTAVDNTVSEAEGDADALLQFNITETVSNLADSNGVELTSVSDSNVLDEEAETSFNESDNFIEQNQQPKVNDNGSIISSDTSQITNFKNFVAINKWKIIAGITIGGIVGGAAGSTWAIINSIAQKNFSDIPTLDEFTSNCVGSVKWPNNSGFELNSATLFTGGLVLGGNLIPEGDNTGGNPESDIDKINDEIISQNLTPESFNYDGMVGQWETWSIVENDHSTILKCPIKSGTMSIDTSTYTFEDGDYINIIVNLEDFKQDQINNVNVTTGAFKFSFANEDVVALESLYDICLLQFKTWFNNNLDQIKRVLQPLLNSGTNPESAIDKINDEITSENLTPLAFNQGDSLEGITGQWKHWSLIEYPATKDTAVFKCSIKSGEFLLDNNTYEFVDGDYVDIKIILADFNQDQIDNAEILIKNAYFSFSSNNSPNAHSLYANCTETFNDWFDNNLDKIKVVLTPLLKS